MQPLPWELWLKPGDTHSVSDTLGLPAWDPGTLWFGQGTKDVVGHTKMVWSTEPEDGSGWKAPQPSPTSLLKQGHPRAQRTGLHPVSSEIFPVRETPHPLWAVCSSVQSLHSKIVLHIWVEFAVSPLSLLPYCWAPLRGAWLPHTTFLFTHALIYGVGEISF